MTTSFMAPTIYGCRPVNTKITIICSPSNYTRGRKFSLIQSKAYITTTFYRMQYYLFKC